MPLSHLRLPNRIVISSFSDRDDVVYDLDLRSYSEVRSTDRIKSAEMTYEMPENTGWVSESDTHFALSRYGTYLIFPKVEGLSFDYALSGYMKGFGESGDVVWFPHPLSERIEAVSGEKISREKGRSGERKVLGVKDVRKRSGLSPSIRVRRNDPDEISPLTDEDSETSSLPGGFQVSPLGEEEVSSEEVPSNEPSGRILLTHILQLKADKLILLDGIAITRDKIFNLYSQKEFSLPMGGEDLELNEPDLGIDVDGRWFSLPECFEIEDYSYYVKIGNYVIGYSNPSIEKVNMVTGEKTILMDSKLLVGKMGGIHHYGDYFSVSYEHMSAIYDLEGNFIFSPGTGGAGVEYVRPTVEEKWELYNDVSSLFPFLAENMVGVVYGYM